MTARVVAAVLGLALSATSPTAAGLVLLSDQLLPTEAAEPVVVPAAEVAPPPPTDNPPLAGWDYNPSDLNGGSRGFAAATLTVNQALPAAR